MQTISVQLQLFATVIAILTFLVVSGTVAYGQSAIELADGQPWTMTNTRGPNGQLVMNADGSGQMRARGMRMGMNWAAEGNRLCITSRIRGTRCVDLVQQGDGYAGVLDGQVAFTLTR